MARPKEKVVMNRVFRFRVSDAVYEKVKRIALESNLTLTEVIRHAIMRVKIPDQTSVKTLSELYAVKKELRRQGGLLKHTLNSFEEFDEFEDAIKSVKLAANACEVAAREANRIFTEMEYKTKAK